MKQLITTLLFLFSLTLSAQTVRVTYDEKSNSIVFGNNRYKMVHVSGGSFMMGATSEQDSNAANEKPIHRVSLSSYNIGQTEVTQALWKAVMGNNPSYFEGDNLPVEHISWWDCRTFISKLNSMTGRKFRLPTEEEWEFAARGGNYSRQYKYSGSNRFGDVAWYVVNSNRITHTVATKQSNELGIYDMSGNVSEWCFDRWRLYGMTTQQHAYVVRGGHFAEDPWCCRVAHRSYDSPDTRINHIGVRLALDKQPSQTSVQSSQVQPLQQVQNQHQQKVKVSYDASSNSIVFGNNRYYMVYVSGGSFNMGATPEQGADAEEDEKPVHRVTVSSYYIGKTEVTQVLWKAIMGNNPSDFEGDNLPVEQVSWNDCQVFIEKLNSITGRTFRLPTEAEWEFAARGGNYSRGYKWSGHGGNLATWFNNTSFGTTKTVATKQANELGLYDMSGNVWEWCSDWYDRNYYKNSDSNNPHGAYTGSYRVGRGGGWNSRAKSCRVSNRSYDAPDKHFNNLGLRLVLVP